MIYEFKTTNDQVTFAYDSVNGLLLDESHSPLTHRMPVDPVGSHSTCRKSSSPHTLKITLGHGCNYDCTYCVQKDIGDPTERPTNNQTGPLIASIRRKLDVSRLSTIEVWGGETLLYWNDITTLMDEFDDERITWMLVTNGTLLSHKHVDKFLSLKGKVSVGLSHDGPAHTITRGPEFLHRKVDVIDRIQREGNGKIFMSFNVVLSQTNYDLFKIDKFFADYLTNNNLTPIPLVFELCRTYGDVSESASSVIQGAALKEYSAILKQYIDRKISDGINNTQTLLPDYGIFLGGSGVWNTSKTLVVEQQINFKSSCGADDPGTLSLTPAGNVRSCQNSDDRYLSGQIITIKDVSVKLDLNPKEKCGSCVVNRLCRGSCPLPLPKANFDVNCAIEYTHYYEILMGAFRLLYRTEISAAA